jgi:hypothetical protein
MSSRKNVGPSRKPLATDLESDWLEEREELAASAREIDPLTNSLGLKFRGAQQRAQASYLAAEEDSRQPNKRR